MKEAVPFFDSAIEKGKPKPLESVASKFDTPLSTFGKYACIDKSRRVPLGSSLDQSLWCVGQRP
jgi:hypothetical protein